MLKVNRSQQFSYRRNLKAMEYKVVELREGLIGGKLSGKKLEKVLNEHANEGWRYKSMTTVDVKGRVGPGGVDGLVIVFEKGN